MISEHERRQLDAIARQLRDEDPGLARRLGAPGPPAPQRCGTAALVLMVCGGIIMVAGVATTIPAAVLLGGAAVVTGWWLRRRTRSLDGSPPPV